MKKAIFFDRDGTLIEDKHYIKDPNEVILLKGVKSYLPKIRDLGYQLFIITNQSGIARGLLSVEDYNSVNQKMIELLEENYFTDISYCPHHPDITGFCTCRKPQPGMILQLAEQYDLDLSESFVVGDKKSDIDLVFTANLKGGFLVRSGYGKVDEKNIRNSEKIFVIEDFKELYYKLKELK